MAPPDHLVLDPSLAITNRIKTSRVLICLIQYEIWNFLPLCLIEQLRKVSNLYFVILIIIMLCMGKNCPINSTTTILPLVLVFTASFIKQGYEDYKRHKSDNMVNRKLINVLVGSQFVQKPSESLKVGDIVFVENDEEFPCDIVLLSSSNSLGTCYITTVNFDGETNLKVLFPGHKLRQCVPQTAHLSYNHEFESFACLIEYDLPTHEIYKFFWCKNRFCGKFTLDVNQEQIEM
ncbi:Phospholipid-transporting ATPase IG [Thelohanellus kitauei]|uniref:Phospholipid-transporting ATPase IG n=1 Tax=Thelohanellus kitauei TaxID=669202 RepID=A0A0C2MNF8_THEKT|nr:Phospholipid-transporting ATPase IG [Thelohanellus kitauei]